MDGLLQKLLAGEDLLAELIGVLTALVLAVALALLLPREQKKLVRAPFGLLVLHVLSLALLPVAGAESSVGRVLAPLAMFFVLASIGRSGVLLGLDVLLGRKLGRPLPRIIRDIVQVVVFAGIGIVSLRQAGADPGSLLTTSAVLTAVLGLSLQETLGNVFAGLAVQMQRPFEVGDWIQFDSESKNIGRVVEINWRATKVVTLDELEIIVPNSALAKAPIRNYSKPTDATRRSVFLQVAYGTPPGRVREVLLGAVRESPGVLAAPTPTVVTNNFGESGVEYWVRYFITEFHRRDLIDSGVRDRIWYALRREGLSIPYPRRTLDMHQVTSESREVERQRESAAREAALRGVDFLAVLPAEDHRWLSDQTELRLYGAGETIVRQGDESREFYIIETGEVVVSVQRAGQADLEVARLGAGKFFGEMAFMTGEKRNANVRAAGDCRILVVGHDAAQQLFLRSPELAERISGVLAERQAELERHATVSPESRARELDEHKTQLLARIKKFFLLG
ncbi:MAG: mechanosensitive ion channel family protein [Myxococcales bacterium]|nr:mechanosensitive ion channel family protein [Myxococcales bacterium]